MRCCGSDQQHIVVSLFVCWFQPAQTSQPTVFFSHNKPAPASLNQPKNQPANRPSQSTMHTVYTGPPKYSRGLCHAKQVKRMRDIITLRLCNRQGRNKHRHTAKSRTMGLGPLGERLVHADTRRHANRLIPYIHIYIFVRPPTGVPAPRWYG